MANSIHIEIYLRHKHATEHNFIEAINENFDHDGRDVEVLKTELRKTLEQSRQRNLDRYGVSVLFAGNITIDDTVQYSFDERAN